MNHHKKTILVLIAAISLVSILITACSSGGESDHFNDNNFVMTSLNGQPALADVEVTANFDGNGGLTGFAGCNEYTGNYGLNEDQIQINVIRTTENICNDDIMNQENEFIRSMGLGESFTPDSDDMTLSDADRVHIITFKRVTE